MRPTPYQIRKRAEDMLKSGWVSHSQLTKEFGRCRRTVNRILNDIREFYFVEVKDVEMVRYYRIVKR